MLRDFAVPAVSELERFVEEDVCKFADLRGPECRVLGKKSEIIVDQKEGELTMTRRCARIDVC